MTALVSLPLPHAHHHFDYTMDPSPFSTSSTFGMPSSALSSSALSSSGSGLSMSSSSAMSISSSSSSSSPHSFTDELPYPDPASRYASASPFHAQHSPSAALQISTATGAAVGQEPEEETAHPSRMQTQLQHGSGGDQPSSLALDDARAHASSSRSPPPTAAAADNTTTTNGAENTLSSSSSSSSSALTSFGNVDEGLSRPLTHKERELLAHLDRLKFFLATAPSRWNADSNLSLDPSHPSHLNSSHLNSSHLNTNSLPVGHPNSMHPALNRFLLPNSEYVSCVLWGGLYHVTGTDIVRALVFRFEAFGRPVRNMKKFEEGVFSDLRNLKPGVDACLEEPKSPFLDLLFKYQCIRTQKKQKVFYWFSVPHDRLFLDALERDLKREKMGLEPTTVVAGEPALSFTYDPKRSLYDQFSKASGTGEGEGELEAAVRRADEAMGDDGDGEDGKEHAHSDADVSSSDADEPGKSSTAEDASKATSSKAKAKSALHGPNSPFFSMFSLFEGSPTYKQRRKKVPKHRSPSALGVPAYLDGPDNVSGGPSEYFPLPGPGHPHAHNQMAQPQVDRYGRDTTRMSAADMFLAQARGDFGPQSNPDLIASQKERQRRAMQARADVLAGKGFFDAPGMHPHHPHQQQQHQQQQQQGMRASPDGMSPLLGMGAGGGGALQLEHEHARPHMDQRHTFPMVGFPAQPPPPHPRAQTFGAPWGEHQQHQQHQQQQQQQQQRTKAFVCPLFSCGRMFKRMEHLKRHLRTHTLERPYQCQRCKKRFSRSDNLNQHLRTHKGGGAAGAGGEEADAESEEVDELELDLEMEMEMEGEEYMGALGAMPDVQMCEVEIQGQVQEVQGDEEGLVVSTSVPQPIPQHHADVLDDGQELYYSDSSASQMVSTPEAFAGLPSPGPGRWTTMQQTHSPAFSTVSMPSPQLGAASAYPHVSEYISMSAPAHKQAFDHASLYPAPADINNGPGPIRRHRSATPSMGRYGGRPFAPAEPRAYHPYAAVAAAHSADSSPMAYTVPLGAYDGVGVGVGGSRAGSSHSRASSGGHALQEQMHQMLNLEGLEPEGMGAYTHEPVSVPVSVPGQGAYSELYRTDSPMQFATATNAYEIEQQQQQQQHEAQQQQGMFAMSLGDTHSYGAHPLDPGYYSAMTHHAVAL